MTSIFSILSVAGFCSLVLMAAEDTANYSLWPRRPAELEQARGLLREQKLQQATELLQPFVAEKGIAGRENNWQYPQLPSERDYRSPRRLKSKKLMS